LTAEKITGLRKNFHAMQVLTWLYERTESQLNEDEDEDADLRLNLILDILEQPKRAKLHQLQFLLETNDEPCSKFSLLQTLYTLMNYYESPSPQKQFMAEWHAAQLDAESQDRSIQDFSEQWKIETLFPQYNRIHSIYHALTLLSQPSHPICKQISEKHRKHLVRLFTALVLFDELGSGERVVTYFKFSDPSGNPEQDRYRLINEFPFPILGHTVRLEVTVPSQGELHSLFKYAYPVPYALYLEEDGEFHGFYFHAENHANHEQRVQAIKSLCKTLCDLWNAAVKEGKLLWFLQQISSGPCIEGATRSVLTIFSAAMEAGNPALVPAEINNALHFYYQCAEAFADTFCLPKTISTMTKLIYDAHQGKAHLKKIAGPRNGEADTWQQSGIVTWEVVENYLRDLGILDDTADENEISKLNAFLKPLPFSVIADLYQSVYSRYILSEDESYPWNHPFFTLSLNPWKNFDPKLAALKKVEFLTETYFINNNIADETTLLMHAILFQRDDIANALINYNGPLRLTPESDFDENDEEDKHLEFIIALAHILSTAPKGVDRLIENFDSLITNQSGLLLLTLALENQNLSEKFVACFPKQHRIFDLDTEEKTEPLFSLLILQHPKYSFKLADQFLRLFPAWANKLDGYLLDTTFNEEPLLPFLFIKEDDNRHIVPDEINLDGLKLLETLLELNPQFSLPGSNALFWYHTDEFEVIDTAFYKLCLHEKGHQVLASLFSNNPAIAAELDPKVLCGTDDRVSSMPALFWLCASDSGRELLSRIIDCCPQHLASIITVNALVMRENKGPFIEKSAARFLLSANNEVSQKIIKTLIETNINLAPVFQKTAATLAGCSLFQNHKKRKDMDDDENPDKNQKTKFQRQGVAANDALIRRCR
ncbi:MAG TPA: hypothetical protein VLH77_03175, partial [Gammaproteobacteria bacterium]|nr:hypothetical protein [Gammaproteobacteria bacterium]